MCVEITNRLYLVLKHLTLVPRYHAYLRSWWLIKLNAMVCTSLYAFPGVYEGRKKKYTSGVHRVMGGVAPPPPPYGQCLQISCFSSVMASLNSVSLLSLTFFSGCPVFNHLGGETLCKPWYLHNVYLPSWNNSKEPKFYIDAILCYATNCSDAVKFNTIQYNAYKQYSTVCYRTVQYITVHYSTCITQSEHLLFSTSWRRWDCVDSLLVVLYCTVLYCIIFYLTVIYDQTIFTTIENYDFFKVVFANSRKYSVKHLDYLVFDVFVWFKFVTNNHGIN